MEYLVLALVLGGFGLFVVSRVRKARAERKARAAFCRANPDLCRSAPVEPGDRLPQDLR